MKESLIDTDILSYFLKGNEAVIQMFRAYLDIYPTISISSITYFEILGGLEYKKATRQIKDFEKLVANFNILNIDKASIKYSSKELGRLRRKGITIGNSDLLIAGIAARDKLTIITNNNKHFKHFKGVKIDNWLKSKK